jgi:hypothetical protein
MADIDDYPDAENETQIPETGTSATAAPPRPAQPATHHTGSSATAPAPRPPRPAAHQAGPPATAPV